METKPDSIKESLSDAAVSQETAAATKKYTPKLREILQSENEDDGQCCGGCMTHPDHR